MVNRYAELEQLMGLIAHCLRSVFGSMDNGDVGEGGDL